MPENDPKHHADAEQIRQVVHEEIQPVYRKLDRIMELMTGNGDPSRGLIVRVDRLEQDKERAEREARQWLTVRMAIIGGAATILSSGIAAGVAIIFK